MSTVSAQHAFDLARRHHHAGRLEEAEALYLKILALHPQHTDALHLSGVLAAQRGDNALAIERLQRTAALNPDAPLVQYHLGNAHKILGNLPEAIAAYHRAIQLQPSYAAALNNLGIALHQAGRLEESVGAFRQAASLRPDYAPGFSNLGDALKGLGRLDEAIEAYHRAISIVPDHSDAHNNLGNALLAKGDVDGSLSEYRIAIALQPNRAEYHSNLGNALKEKKLLHESAAAYQQAIALAPEHDEAHYNLANVLKDGGLLDEAIAVYRRTIALRPNYAEAHYNLGNALKDSGRIKEAIAEYRAAIALNPNLPEAGDNLLYAMLFEPVVDSQAIAKELRSWNSRHALPLQRDVKPHQADPDPDRRLRIGYVGADFWEHCQSLFLSPLLSSHDRSRVEVFCYAGVRRPDARTAELRSRADAWRDVFKTSDEDLAAKIREDRIDVLIDLTMHMAGNRLLSFARKPAPVQATWLAYPGSTGLTAIDYRLSDPYLDPAGMEESVYSEQTLRLPDSFWCYDPIDGRGAAVGELPAVTAGHITFGCLNNFCKINEVVLDLWSAVLKRAADSRVLLLAPPGTARQRIADEFGRRGVHSGRIEFVGYQPRRQYLETYHRIDIGLDTVPYNGHTTSLDAFWMGVPVITLIGTNAVSRAGWSQLSNLGLPELAAQSPEQFTAIAENLATDIPRLRELRAALRSRLQQSPLMDAPRFARNLETAYRQMWQDWCRNQST